ncbi:hypothetical protein M0P65_07455 [Candidatus Gracilibacteria bacterium]|jgi:hypothetical protein|nr:hypothetical protein [Candidatus Gracilibacteria bacterium]
MEKEIKVIPPDGFRIVSVNLFNNEITATIEKKKEDDFGKYWKRCWFERYNIINYKSFDYYDWEVLINFYRWFAKELNGDWKPNWKCETQKKYCICYDYDFGKYEIDCKYSHSISFGITFSKETAEKALEICPKEFLDKLFQI